VAREAGITDYLAKPFTAAALARKLVALGLVAEEAAHPGGRAPIGVLICDDSATIRGILSATLGTDPDVKVVGTAINGAATTFMRSDAAPALDLAAALTWTAAQTISVPMPGPYYGYPGPNGLLLDTSTPATALDTSINSPTLMAQGRYWNGSSSQTHGVYMFSDTVDDGFGTLSARPHFGYMQDGITTDLFSYNAPTNFLTFAAILSASQIQAGFLKLIDNIGGVEFTELVASSSVAQTTTRSINFDCRDGNRTLTLDGDLTLTGANIADTWRVSTAGGYKSSDGSSGYTGTVTTASLSGKTITIKDGLITAFA
jgi:CheY-like chemotaxis protein